MSKCICGRTFRPPYCDSSHWLSDEEYATLREKVNKLYENKNVKTTIRSNTKTELLKANNVFGSTGSSDCSTL